jgi:hypothetical protein
MLTLPRGQRSLIYVILQWIWDRSRSNTLDELRSCGEKEVERIARDSGISASDFPALVRLGPNASDLLERRMVALDLDRVEVCAIAPETFRDLQRVCSFCQSHRRCLRDLAHDPAKPDWRDYCPNVETLMALDAMPWTSRREWQRIAVPPRFRQGEGGVP